MNCLSYLNNKAVIITASPDETKLLGSAIGCSCYPGLTLMLYGELGMGKTLLTQGIGSALGYKRIKSPTFIILAEHEGDLPLVHADLYRLDSNADVDSLDLENYIEQGCLLTVEWAERWNTGPTDDRLDIRMEPIGCDNSKRQITIEAIGKKAEEILDKVVKMIFGESDSPNLNIKKIRQ